MWRSTGVSDGKGAKRLFSVGRSLMPTGAHDMARERKEEIWDVVTAEITRRYGNNSSVSIDNEAICVSGTK